MRQKQDIDMEELFRFLTSEGIEPALIKAAREFRDACPAAEEDRGRIPAPVNSFRN